jgi:uncharacterized protein YigE (DUF2233 family)
MMRFLAATALALLITLPCAAAPCEQHSFEGSTFTVCGFDAARQELRLAWTDSNGTALRGFPNFRRAMGHDAQRVLFAMNAGMFEEDGRPLGLYVEDGNERRPLNTRNASGNFYLKPNGVFEQMRDGTVAVAETGSYAARGETPILATQSGPLLVSGGVFNPQISADGPSRNIRNGVGVSGPKTAYFVISDDPVSFGRMARFFRDELHCPDALYFDGTISSAWIPSEGRMDTAYSLGPMITVLRRN